MSNGIKLKSNLDFYCDLPQQANEVERLVTWYNPLSLSDRTIPGEDTIATWRSQSITEKQYRELARQAWDTAPELAVFLPARLVYVVKSFVRSNNCTTV